MLEEGVPIFLQIADSITRDIVDGVLAEGDRVSSTNEFAAFYRINPATAAKGINLLVDDGIVEKRRGVGMFVRTGARERLVQQRKQAYFETYVKPMIIEARRLGFDEESLLAMISQGVRQ